MYTGCVHSHYGQYQWSRKKHLLLGINKNWNKINIFSCFFICLQVGIVFQSSWILLLYFITYYFHFPFQFHFYFYWVFLVRFDNFICICFEWHWLCLYIWKIIKLTIFQLFGFFSYTWYYVSTCYAVTYQIMMPDTSNVARYTYMQEIAMENVEKLWLNLQILFLC